MLRSNIRHLTAALTAVAIFGVSASIANAGNDLVISKQVLKAKAQQTEPSVDLKFTGKLPVIHVPDLQVSHYQFLGGSAKPVLVKVKNAGNTAVGPSVLRLTVRRIDGVAVGRTVDVNLPGFVANAEYTVSVATAGILPNNVALKDTTFRLGADATNTVVESNETNNTTWHNL